MPENICRHCGHDGEEGGDHTCPCPFPDADCPDHPAITVTTLYATCRFCDQTRTYDPRGMLLALQTNAITALEFFCIACHEFNRHRIETEVAERLADHGVPTTFVDVPLELLEHPVEGTPAITPTDVARMEGVSMDVFNRLVRFELGDRVAGDD